uniref:SGNH hydrolase-type esterase domain-containing protein n=1 Tax=Helicotheca tamesis TaxID=374047 RepID=A0A7S2MZY9_9STRA|eukprot:CAMPEP_0185727186 /NCGR_PEP_ID=MMETSP1171-20130828/2942_1 /TAXON_ID=374046 /ORGANISM="Helicotheca tamensis, Strain CCMP826" /LENGTH=441 /DNA_ID=CAMNT_0028395697 /DNA_START=5 /DNA_END=1330 /DNA_ORIENTATION=-
MADSVLSSTKKTKGSTSSQQQQHQSVLIDLNEITRIPTNKRSNRRQKKTKKTPFSSSAVGLDITAPNPKTKAKESKRYCCSIIRFTFILTILIFSVRTYLLLVVPSFSTMRKNADYNTALNGIGIRKKDEDTLGTKFDLNIGKVDHWCLNGDDDSCSCLDPTEAVSRIERRPWFNAHESNKNLIKEAVMSEYLDAMNDFDNDGVDVVFLGDSIIEEWNGRWLGREMEHLKYVKVVFEQMFQKKNGGKVEGLALGIAGDVAPNLLWRIQNGEMPDNLNPSVWWILIGTNDFGTHHCSGEIVFMGIQRIVEEIMHRKPDANTKIVINSILPRTFESDGKLVNGTVLSSPDLWPRIDAVNHELKHFCKEHDQLEFFDAGYIFRGEAGNKQVERTDGYILPERMMDHVHPTALGHKLWGLAIIKKLTEILKLEDEGNEDDDKDMR